MIYFVALGHSMGTIIGVSEAFMQKLALYLKYCKLKLLNKQNMFTQHLCVLI